MRRICVSSFVLLLASVPSTAQTDSPAFEAASVKPFTMTPGNRPTPFGGGPGTKTPTRVTGVTTVQMLLMRAYDVKSFQISAPPWIETALYEINATMAQGTTKEQFAAMLRKLLAERFRVTARKENKQVPMYALLVGKNGPKLSRSDPAAIAEDERAAAEGPPAVRPRVTMGPDGFPQIPPDAKLPGSFTLSLSSGEFLRVKLFARHQTMDQLADNIGAYVKRPVKNLTAIDGKFDFTLAFEADPRADARPLSASPEDAAQISPDRGATIFSAVQEQLGLKLESRKGPVEMLLIDRIERNPIEN